MARLRSQGHDVNSSLRLLAESGRSGSTTRYSRIRSQFSWCDSSFSYTSGTMQLCPIHQRN